MKKAIHFVSLGTLIFALLAIAIYFREWLHLRDFDFAKLKEWQTLIASLIALSAAILAYSVNRSKVNFDRAIYDREIHRKRLALYLKLHLALRHLTARSRRVADRVASHNYFLHDRVIRIDDIEIEEPPEFDAAWDLLDLLPIEVIVRLARMRTIIRNQKRRIEITEEKEWRIPARAIEIPIGLKKLGYGTVELWRTSAHTANLLEKEVKKLVPTLPNIAKRFGEKALLATEELD